MQDANQGLREWLFYSNYTLSGIINTHYCLFSLFYTRKGIIINIFHYIVP